MEKLTNKQIIEGSSLYLDLSESLLNKIDLFLSNTELNKQQQLEFVKILEEVRSEGYVSSLTD
jgi:hypothetical protein